MQVKNQGCSAHYAHYACVYEKFCHLSCKTKTSYDEFSLDRHCAYIHFVPAYAYENYNFDTLLSFSLCIFFLFSSVYIISWTSFVSFEDPSILKTLILWAYFVYSQFYSLFIELLVIQTILLQTITVLEEIEDAVPKTILQRYIFRQKYIFSVFYVCNLFRTPPTSN